MEPTAEASSAYQTCMTESESCLIRGRVAVASPWDHLVWLPPKTRLLCRLRSSPVCINQENGDVRAFEFDVMKGCVMVERVECITGVDQKNCFSPILLENISYSMNC